MAGVYEDALPASISKEQYDWWFKESLVLDGVRMGPPLTTKPQSTTLEPCPMIAYPVRVEPEPGYKGVACVLDSNNVLIAAMMHSDHAQEVVALLNTRISASAAPVVDNNDLISRAAAKAAMCNMCANPDRYKPAEPLEGSMRLFHFQRSDNWNAGQCLAQAIDSVPAAAPVEQSDSLLAQIATIADLGSAEEFGDALERLQSIRRLIDEHEGAR